MKHNCEKLNKLSRIQLLKTLETPPRELNRLHQTSEQHKNRQLRQQQQQICTQFLQRLKQSRNNSTCIATCSNSNDDNNVGFSRLFESKGYLNYNGSSETEFDVSYNQNPRKYIKSNQFDVLIFVLYT